MKTRRGLFVAALAVFLTFFFAGCGNGTPSLSILTTFLPGDTIGSPYNATVQASGGAAPFTWSVSAGALPDNVTLGTSSTNSATISGTPDRVQASVSFTIQVSDANNQTATQSYTVAIASSPTIVVTQSGAVQGIVQGDILAFRGVPYAAPPTGNLRWRPPQPPLSWSGIRDASTFGNLCPQSPGGTFVGDEDCLVLNIFVVQPAAAQPLPVMVFFHGGGNEAGGTQQAPFDLPPLANQGVIVVTAEYRLGALGFLALSQLTVEDGLTSGNYGLEDQIAALTWVQQNIAAFGGDPTHVMMFGQSAGAGDTELLLTSPLAKGLFSAAGMESGAYHSARLETLAQAEASDASAVSLYGCGGAMDVLACLRAVPEDTIVANEGSISYIKNGNIDGHVVPLDPLVALQQNGSPVPLLIGSNREENAGINDDPTVTPPLTDAGYQASVDAEYDPLGAGVANQILALYPVSSYDAPIYALVAVDSDSLLTCPTRETARGAAGASRPAVWRYLYIHRYENNATLNLYRAFHTAELYFVFGNEQEGPLGVGPYTPTAAEVTFAGQMMGYWTRFAATGNPNGAGAVQWPAYDSTTDAMLQLDDTFVQINGYHNPQCDYLATLPFQPPSNGPVYVPAQGALTSRR
jgi:para-nitrobenzyl esterase